VSTYPTNPPLSWEAAVERFKIPRMHQSAKMAQFPSEMAQDARSWIGRLNYSLYISGSSGSGKTQFCVALLKELISLKKFSWIIFIRSDELDDELLSSVKEGHESYVLEKYHTVPILFLDDLGVERLNERIIKQYYSIIDRRLNNFLPTVFSSNILRKDIAKNLGERIASRLHLADEMIFPDKDYRKE
jgi:DNA replication protein DnaC